jgi:outer membrane protein TolC
MSARLIIATAALALFLNACAKFESRPLSPAAAAVQLESRSLTNSNLKAYVEEQLKQPLNTWPSQPWDFDMLMLASFYYQPALGLARAQWAVAQGGEVTAGQRPNPSLNVTPGYNTTTTLPSPWIPLAFLDVPIETAGKRKHRRAQAAELSEAARLNIATVAWQARSSLRSSLVDLVAAGQRAQLLGKQLELQEQIVTLLEQQIQAGALAGPETLVYRIALQKTQIDLADAKRIEAEARSRVAEAVGISVEALDTVRLKEGWPPLTASVSAFTSTEARRSALESRPDVLGALASYAAAESALRLQIARQYPDVRLQPGYQYDQGDNKWTLGITVELPILNQNQGPIAEAQARRQEVAAHFEVVQAKVLSEVERATRSVQLAEENLKKLHGLTSQQEKRRDAVAAQYEAGAAEQLDLLTAGYEQGVAALAELDGKLKYQQALGTLEDAVQRPMFGRLEPASTSKLAESPQRNTGQTTR